MSQLFVETKDPNYIYNQARCFEQNARWQEAVARFQEYLRVSKSVSDEDRAETQKHIADCQGNIDKDKQPGPGAAPVVSNPRACL